MRRTVHRSSLSGSREIADIIQTLFIRELLVPSKCIWLISPWISDIPVIDNTAFAFSGLSADWGAREVRLSEVLRAAARAGTAVIIATRPDRHNESFLRRLAAADGVESERIVVHNSSSDLHEKGLLTDQMYIDGSMNYTYRGILINDEAVGVSSEPTEIAAAKLICFDRWGGEVGE